MTIYKEKILYYVESEKKNKNNNKICIYFNINLTQNKKRDNILILYFN
jgi:hypothetical protein